MPPRPFIPMASVACGAGERLGAKAGDGAGMRREDFDETPAARVTLALTAGPTASR